MFTVKPVYKLSNVPDDLKWTTNTFDPIYTHYIYGFGRLLLLNSFTRPPYFYPSIFVFTRPNDGWMGLYIKLCHQCVHYLLRCRHGMCKSHLLVVLSISASTLCCGVDMVKSDWPSAAHSAEKVGWSSRARPTRCKYPGQDRHRPVWQPTRMYLCRSQRDDSVSALCFSRCPQFICRSRNSFFVMSWCIVS